MPAPAPVYRGQGNNPFQSFKQDGIQKRGQTVPYDVNGSPTPPAAVPRSIAFDIMDLPLAVGTDPLAEFLTPAGDLNFTGIGDHVSAGVAATGASALRIFKNGSQVGTISFGAGGTTGTVAFTDSSYVEGDLFGLYPPAAVDATLDRVRITLGTD